MLIRVGISLFLPKRVGTIATTTAPFQVRQSTARVTPILERWIPIIPRSHNQAVVAIRSAASFSSRTRHDVSPTEAEQQEMNRKSQYETDLQILESQNLYGRSPNLKSLEQLATWVSKRKLKLDPKYQRGYVWEEDRASRLVVTVLCNRLVPGLVLHEKEKGKFEVVDGKQRLTTLISFYLAEKMMQVGMTSSFHRLSKLDENYDALNGLTFKDLSEERQSSYENYEIACSIIPHSATKEEVFSCYEDINSGGEDLSAQQVRRAVFYGEYIEMLDRLAKNEDFQCILKPEAFRKGKYELCPRESDRELILRAFAWARNHASYKSPIKSFLNTELRHYGDLSKTNPEKVAAELRQYEDDFAFIMKTWRNVFSEEDGAFRVWEKKKDGTWGWKPAINKQLWDVLYLVLKELRRKYPTESSYTRKKKELLISIKNIFELGKLDFSSRPTAVKFTDQRDTFKRGLETVLSENDGKRNFTNTSELKRVLFERQGGLCTICNQTIDRNRLDDGSYVHLDHLHPYAKGGQSTDDNARLTHAACNRSKGARA